MNSLQRNAKQILSILYSVCLIAIIIGLVIYHFSYAAVIEEQSVYMKDFHEDWNVTINGEEYTDIDINDFDIPKTVVPGDEVVLENYLPTNIADESTLRILMYLSTMDVYVNDRLVYSYGDDIAEKGEFVGSGYHFIRLPNRSAGEAIKIVIHPTEHAAFTNIPGIEIVSASYAYPFFFQSNLLSVFCGVFLFVVGFVLSVSGLIARVFNRVFTGLANIGFFSLCIGMWTLCNTKIVQIYAMDFAFNSTFEYLSLYFAFPTVVGVIINMRSDTVGLRRIILYLCKYISLAFAVLTTVLHLTDIMHYPSSLTFFHIMAVAMMVVVIALGIKPFKLMEKHERILNVDIIMLMAFALADLLRFNIQKYFLPSAKILTYSILPVGTVVFITVLIIAFIVYMYNRALSINEKNQLTKLAFEDRLTGVYNRSKSEELFAKYDAAGDIKYTIINLDLNGLKKINDTYGHASGDILIQRFANVLKDAFGKIGTVIRMGGDEFIILIDHSLNPDLDRAIKKMKELEMKYSQDLDFDIEASYGIAKSEEFEMPQAEKVYKLADERMYEMKLKSKNRRV